MYLADNHMHSTCSPDGEDTMADMALAAARAGLDSVCFTDHFDLLSMEGTVCLVRNWTPVRQAFAEARSRVGGAMEVRCGVEIGGVPTDPAAAERALAEPLDFVIASVHNLSLEAGATDFYDVTYTSPEMCRPYLDDYFASLEATVAWGKFDVVGHIPYLLRYMRDRDGVDIDLAEYDWRIRNLLRNVADMGKGIECNTNKGGSLKDYVPILKEFRALGGEIVTIGADAHRTADAGAGVAEAQGLLRECGFDYHAVFRGRQPEFYPL